MFKAFYDYIYFRVIRNDKIKYLKDNIEYKYLKYLGDILFFYKEDLEVLFLLYILAEEVYDIPLNKIEEVFSEETTFNLYESVENVTYSNIDNMYLENSFKYSELIEDNEVQPYVDTYDLSIESYEKDIIEKCIDNIKNDITGYVFNNQQAREILDFLNQNQYKYKSEIKNGIYFFKKI